VEEERERPEEDFVSDDIVPGESIEMSALDLIPHDPKAAGQIAAARTMLGAEQWAELVQAGLLNAPENAWLVVTVKAGGRMWELQTDVSDLPDSCQVTMTSGDARISLTVLRLRNERWPTFRCFSITGNARTRGS
jgi:hypothetical protein